MQGYDIFLICANNYCIFLHFCLFIAPYALSYSFLPRRYSQSAGQKLVRSLLFIYKVSYARLRSSER